MDFPSQQLLIPPPDHIGHELAAFKSVVEAPHDFGGLEVGGVLGVHADGLFPLDEGKGADVLVEFGKREVVLDDELAAPEEVYVNVLPLNVLNRLLESGHRAAGFAEDLEEGVPKGFGLSVLAGLPRPIRGRI